MALSRASTGELGLNIRLIQLHARRNALHDAPDTLAVGFSKRGDFEQLSERTHCDFVSYICI